MRAKPGSKLLSVSKGLALLGKAANTNNATHVAETFVALKNDGGFWSTVWRVIQIHTALCENYAGIINNANGILNSTAASASDKAWAQGKKDDAIAGQHAEGCSINVS